MTPRELHAAYGKTVPDLVAPRLRVLFCGINPSLYSAAVGHHFARPGNRFWKALHRSGLTPRLFRPDQEKELLALGIGITNLVRRATASADELENEELQSGAAALRRKVTRYRPAAIAFLGVGAYRTAMARPKAMVGLQSEPLVRATTWVLPNPSGLNAHYQLADLARCYAQLARAVRRA